MGLQNPTLETTLWAILAIKALPLGLPNDNTCSKLSKRKNPEKTGTKKS